MNPPSSCVQYIHCWTLYIYTVMWCGPGSSVSVVTDYGLDSTGSNPSGDKILRLSRPAMGPTQPPVN